MCCERLSATTTLNFRTHTHSAWNRQLPVVPPIGHRSVMTEERGHVGWGGVLVCGRIRVSVYKTAKDPQFFCHAGDLCDALNSNRHPRYFFAIVTIGLIQLLIKIILKEEKWR